MPIQISQHTSLSDWTEEWVKDILDNDRGEDSLLEFKAVLNSRDPKHNDNIRKAVCSFANTFGGFIIFGIKDKNEASGWDRLCDDNNTDNFSKELTDKLGSTNVVPHVVFDGPKVIPLSYQNKSYPVVIIKVNGSELKPHAIVSDNGLLHFWIRGNASAIPASHPFLTKLIEESAGLRNLLAALYLDTEYIDLFGEQMMLPESERSNKTPFVQIKALVNSEQSSALISKIPTDIPLIQLIWALRTKIDLVNNYRDMMVALRSTALSNKNEIYKNHNDCIAVLVPEIKEITKKIRSHLIQKYIGVRDWINVVQASKP